MKEKLKKLSDYEFELDKQGSMKVPAKFFISEKLLKDVEENAIQQLVNVATLKGIQKYALAMPDIHSGYGFPIGGVAAFDVNEGIISPGGVGYDINCGVRMLTTDISVKEFLKKRTEIINEIYKNVPSGVGSKGKIKVSRDILGEVIQKGAKWAVDAGYGTKEDLQRIEEYGYMRGALFGDISNKAVERGMPQLGSLGAGNHFLEIQQIDEIFNEKISNVFGINKENVTVMIHCGSRGLGHQVASDYIKLMEDKYGFKDLPDRELINAPVNSDLGRKYYSAMIGSVNFAFANRQMIMHWIRESFDKIFGKSKLSLIYDVCHNVAKIEKHIIDNNLREVCVHRKGASRSFGPGRDEIPEIYRNIGQPVIIPGSMGTASYLLVGTKKAEEISFGSTAHGAGRVCSRSAALRNLRGENIKNELSRKGIEVKSGSWKSIAEEAPQVYKDVDEVVRVSHEIGIGNLVVKVKPLGCIKG